MSKNLFKEWIPEPIRQSLQYRLLAFLLLSLIVLMSITTIIGKITADHEFGEILDGQMIVTGRAVFSLVSLELSEQNESEIPRYLDSFVRSRQGIGDWIGQDHHAEVYDNDFYFQLIDPSGVTVFASLEPALLQIEDAAQGLFDVYTQDGHWHLFGMEDEYSGYTFYTGQSQELRYELSNESIEYLLLPFFLLTLISLGAIWLGARYGLKPLLQLTKELDKRDPKMLEAIDHESKATEIRPLVKALNKLFERVSIGLERERQFSADASHELRTPLAGIKANLDAARILSAVPEQQKYLDNIEISVDNATNITEGLLILSRLQSANLGAYFDTQRFNLNNTVQAEINKQIILNPSLQARIQTTITSEQIFILSGSVNLAEIAIGNVLSNALKYSTGGVSIDVQRDSNKDIVVTVSDDGNGIPESEQSLVLQRFYRINTDAKKGYGLGLALVHQAMCALGGSVLLTNRSPRGLDATLIFPAP